MTKREHPPVWSTPINAVGVPVPPELEPNELAWGQITVRSS